MNRVQFVQANRILLIPISQIVANPFQKRVEYGDIGELADRIAAAYASFEGTMGLMQVPRGRVVNGGSEPVPFQKVAPVSEDSADWVERGLRVQLMYGHRRYEAFKLLVERGDERYSQAVMPVQITDATNRDMVLSVWEENERRQNLSAIEQAHLMAAAKEELGEKASQRDVAEFFGLARPTVANRMSLLELPEEVQNLNRTGKLSERQLLAMKPLYELSPVVEISNRHWADGPGGWAACKPETYIRHIVEHPDKYTSDDIREFANKVEKSVGEDLPKSLADFSFAPAGMLQASDPDYDLAALGIEQAICKGCPFRRNSRCLKPSCLEAKVALFGRRLANEVAGELGLTYSNEKAHFYDMSQADRNRLSESFAEGHRCDHLVVGWNASWWGLRPFLPEGQNANDDPFSGRNSVMVGHVGPFKTGCIKNHGAPEEIAIVESLADPEMVERWKKAAKKQERAIKDRMRLWFTDHFAFNFEVKRMMLAFMDGERGLEGDEDAVDRSLANYVIEKFYLGSGGIFNYYQSLSKRIAAAGINPDDVLECGRHPKLPSDHDAILKDAAIRILVYWYECRGYTWGDYAEKAQTEINRLVELISGRFIGDVELLELSAALDVAARDAALVLKKKQVQK